MDPLTGPPTHRMITPPSRCPIARRWQAQRDATCVYVVAATGAASCTADPSSTYLAADGLSSVLGLVLVRGAVLPVADFEDAVGGGPGAGVGARASRGGLGEAGR